jgi:hypothetical protein
MPVNRKEVRLRPLPLRITPLQFTRLTEARARDSLAIQEHVRRAIDVYLDQVEKIPPPASSTPTSTPTTRARKASQGRAYAYR